MRKNENEILTPAESAWRLFQQTGEISYYLLYKKLLEK